MITILGLGPGNPNLLTREAWDILSNAREIYLRTRKHPTVSGLPSHLKLHDFDGIYDTSTSFEKVYARIVSTLLKKAKTRDVIYAVPGHPLIGESTVPMLIARAQAANIETRLVSGLSFIEPVLETLTLAKHPRLHAPRPSPFVSFDPFDGLQLCDALDLASAHHPPLNPDKPALIAQVYSRAVASDLKLTLMNQYSPMHEVLVVKGENTMEEGGRRMLNSRPSSTVLRRPLHDLDRHDDFDHLTTLYLPATQTISSLESLQETMAHLRAPEGCPWDQEQTHQSLRNTLLEETYEVLTAIDEDDPEALKEELGDLLFNVLFQVQMATEAEEFRMIDVIGEVDAKLKRRHPHVFGKLKVSDQKVISANWDAIKKQEHKHKGQERKSALDGIAPALPALAQAQKMSRRAGKTGFEWANAAQLLAKIQEELSELLAAPDNAQRQEELGDLFFTLADWADAHGIDAETAAREANQKFARRFRELEKIVKRRKLDMKSLSTDKLLTLWQIARQHTATAR